MPVEIRELAKGDAEDLLSLRRRALREEPFGFLSSPEDDVLSSLAAVRRSLGKAPDSITFGAAAPELVGMLGIYRAGHSKAAHKSHLWGMYVRPDFRRQGIGRRLLEAAIEHAHGLGGVTVVGLSVSETANAAKRLYESGGFRAWGTEPDALRVDGCSAREYHMALSLTGAKRVNS